MDNTFIINQKPLMTILSSMQPMCTRRTTIDATGYIMVSVGHKEVVFKSTDLEISLQASYLLQENSISEPYAFLVSGKRLSELVKELDGDIQFQVTDRQLTLNAGSVNLDLNIRDTNDFPPFPERIENLMQLEAEFLLAMLGKVAFLIPTNNANPALNGLYIEISAQELKLTTTDGHCLAQVRTPQYTLGESYKWLMPRRAVFELKKILESADDAAIFLGLCGNQLVFSGESFNFFTKLLVDPFPSYESILSKDSFRAATVDRTHLTKTLRRASCLLSGQFLATQFGFSPDKLNVLMQNKEVGTLKEEVPLQDFDGEKLDIRFYAPYLLNGLQAFNEEKVTLYLRGSAKPIMFESSDANSHLVYLVMPVSPTAA